MCAEKIERIPDAARKVFPLFFQQLCEKSSHSPWIHPGVDKITPAGVIRVPLVIPGIFSGKQKCPVLGHHRHQSGGIAEKCLCECINSRGADQLSQTMLQRDVCGFMGKNAEDLFC